MKVIDIGQTTLEGSVTDAQHERVVVTHKVGPLHSLSAWQAWMKTNSN